MTILLHLVNDDKRPVSPELREAIHRAYLYAVHQFPRVDEAILANMAEALAISMCRRLDQIKSIKQYALAAMVGKVHQWLRSHSLVVIPTNQALESVAGGTPDRAFKDIENEILFEQIKAKLKERDRQILVLIEQGMGTPAAISAALGLTPGAAKKALYRAKEKMSAILAKPDENRPSVVSRESLITTEAIAPEVKS